MPSGITRKVTFLSSLSFLEACHCLVIYPQFYTHSCKYVHFDSEITLLLILLLLEGKALITKLMVIITPHQMNKKISCGINSTLCTRACVAIFVCLPHLSPDFLGEIASHSLGLYGDSVLEFYFTVGQLHTGQISFGPPHHHPKIHCREHIERIPLKAKTG